MIGRELTGSHGLLEWFFSQQGQSVRGFKRAIFSGFTTQALADLIARIITDHPSLAGVWHVGSEPISKFDLLTLVKQTYGLAIEIEPENDFVCDRSLDSTRFRAATGIQPLSWPEMIENMRADPTAYEGIRKYQHMILKDKRVVVTGGTGSLGLTFSRSSSRLTDLRLTSTGVKVLFATGV
jgi:dTDP-4-dehydrorhamnose reductase